MVSLYIIVYKFIHMSHNWFPNCDPWSCCTGSHLVLSALIIWAFYHLFVFCLYVLSILHLAMILLSNALRKAAKFYIKKKKGLFLGILNSFQPFEIIFLKKNNNLSHVELGHGFQMICFSTYTSIWGLTNFYHHSDLHLPIFSGQWGGFTYYGYSTTIGAFVMQ